MDQLTGIGHVANITHGIPHPSKLRLRTRWCGCVSHDGLEVGADDLECVCQIACKRQAIAAISELAAAIDTCFQLKIGVGRYRRVPPNMTACK